MKICITGALGHIGSKLIRTVSFSDASEVYCVDNMLTQRYASLFNLPDGVPFRFVEADIFSPVMEDIIKECDVVIHLAAITNAEASVKNPELVDYVNRHGLEHVAQLCSRHTVALLFFSTTSVYGVQTEVVDETCTDAELQPQSPYAHSKRSAEKYLQDMVQNKQLRCVIFRLGTIFGFSAGMRFHTAVNKFIWQAVNGQEITVWKTALHQKRPYCGLQDCVRAIMYVLDNDRFDGEIYNIVTTNLTVNDIIEDIKYFVPELKVAFVDSAIMNQLSYNVANKKSRTAGFHYQDTVHDCVDETIRALKNINHTIRKTNLE